MIHNETYNIEKTNFSIIAYLKFTFVLSVLLFSCSNNLDKWFTIDNKKAILNYNESEYMDFAYDNQHDIDLPRIDSLSGETKFIKSDSKINLGFKMRIELKGKYDMYQIKFGFKFLDKDGFVISDYVENTFDLCPATQTNSFQDKIETKLTDEELNKVNSVVVKLNINDVKSSKERYDQTEKTQ